MMTSHQGGDTGVFQFSDLLQQRLKEDATVLGLHNWTKYMCSTDIFTCWNFVIPMLCRGRVGPGVSDGAGPGILSSRGVQPTVAQPRQRYIFTSLILLLKDLFPGLARGLFPHQPAQEAQVLMRRWRRREL